VIDRRESGAADDAYEHRVDLYEDILGERPAQDATPAELVAAIREVWEALERIN
jgi:hypothetical protein